MVTILIGLDPGVTTGFARWDTEAKRLVAVSSMAIHAAMAEVLADHQAGRLLGVVFEDSRLRTWFGTADKRQAASGAGIREGVGSVKRDCSIWQDFLADHGIAFRAIRPAKGGTKWPAAYFAKATGWTTRTNNHGRDAAVIVLGRKSL